MKSLPIRTSYAVVSLAWFSSIGVWGADWSTPAGAEQEIASVVRGIAAQVEHSVARLSPSAPVPTSEFQALEQYVDEYLRRHGEKVSVANPVWVLTNACNPEAVQRDYERILPVGKQRNAYVEVNNKLKEKYDKLLQLSAYDVLAQGIGLILFPPESGMDIFQELGLQVIEDYMTPKYRPLGADRLRSTAMPKLASELKPDQEKLLAVLREAPANKNDVPRICREAQRLAASCEEKSSRIYAELLREHEEFKKRAPGVLAYVASIATEVDRILQRRAHLVLCEVSPSPLALPGVSAYYPLTLHLVYDSGLRRQALYNDVVFEQDEPPVVRLYPNAGTGHAIVEGVAEGTGEVRIRSKADGKLLGSFRVEVARRSAPASLAPQGPPPPINPPPSAGFPAVDFTASPDKRVYSVGEPIRFTQIAVSNVNDWTFTWYVTGDEKTGVEIDHAFSSRGLHTVRLVVRSKATGEEDALARTITVGDAEGEEEPPPPGESGAGTVAPPVGPIGQVNDFVTETLRDRGVVGVAVRFYRGGSGDWSEPVSFVNTEGAQDVSLQTGEQADGYNTGWLLYAGNGKPRFKLLGCDFGRRTGRVVYEGALDLQGQDYKPGSLKFKTVHARCAKVTWEAANGSLYGATIWKSPTPAVPNPNSFVKTGVEYENPIEFREPTESGQVNAPGELTIGGSGTNLFVNVPPGMANVTASMELSSGVKAVGAVAADGVFVRLEDMPRETGREFVFALSPGRHLLPCPDTRKLPADARAVDVKLFDNTTKALLRRHLAPLARSETAVPLRKDEKPGPVLSEFRYGSGVWPVRLQDGVLEVRGNGRWAWGDQWKLVDRYVKEFNGVGTDQGPGLAYTRDGRMWDVILLNYQNGDRVPVNSYSEKVEVYYGGQYGFSYRVGGHSFSYNHGLLKEIDPATGNFLSP
ncbi:MAG: hypothetical protein KA248_06965 [Kiritimatiellae bacterium]|nr:hypothetical protein [Kiritimatiellia bacterium]